MAAILNIAQLKKKLNMPKVASSWFFMSRVYSTRICKKNICYVPKWGHVPYPPDYLYTFYAYSK